MMIFSEGSVDSGGGGGDGHDTTDGDSDGVCIEVGVPCAHDNTFRGSGVSVGECRTGMWLL